MQELEKISISSQPILQSGITGQNPGKGQMWNICIGDNKWDTNQGLHPTNFHRNFEYNPSQLGVIIVLARKCATRSDSRQRREVGADMDGYKKLSSVGQVVFNVPSVEVLKFDPFSPK